MRALTSLPASCSVKVRILEVPPNAVSPVGENRADPEPRAGNTHLKIRSRERNTNPPRSPKERHSVSFRAVDSSLIFHGMTQATRSKRAEIDIPP